MIGEACVLALFLAIFSTGFENINATELTAYSSKIGRRIIKYKLLASLFATAICFVIIATVSLGLFLLRFDFSAVWGDNVSSFFNVAYHSLDTPFITWRSYTVLAYLMASISLGFALAMVFCFFGFTLGLLFRNSFAAIITAVCLVTVMFLGYALCDTGSLARGLVVMTPVWFVFRAPIGSATGARM